MSGRTQKHTCAFCVECDKNNHASVVQYPHDIEAYLSEERACGAILGPFRKYPIDKAHYSPFMSRDKPGSKNCRVVIALSWPKGSSVNDGIHKDSYLNTDFCLTFPTVDTITDVLRELGKGAHLYNINVSRAFCHVKVDPGDHDLLGLHWGAFDYVDTCIPFGSRHGMQIFQRLHTSP